MNQYERETCRKRKDCTIGLINVFQKKSRRKKGKKWSETFCFDITCCFHNNVFLPYAQFKRQHQPWSHSPVCPCCSLLTVWQINFLLNTWASPNIVNILWLPALCRNRWTLWWAAALAHGSQKLYPSKSNTDSVSSLRTQFSWLKKGVVPFGLL